MKVLKSYQVALCVVLGYAMFSMLSMTGCVVAAAPLIIQATKGSKASTATILINDNADKVYAEAITAIKQRGYTEITKQDDAKRYIEGTRKGKHATFQAIPVDNQQTRVILTIEQDQEGTDLNEAVQALMQLCNQLELQCQEQKSS